VIDLDPDLFMETQKALQGQKPLIIGTVKYLFYTSYGYKYTNIKWKI